MSWVKGKVPRIMRLTEVGTEAKKQQATGSRDWNADRTVNLCCFGRVSIHLLQYLLKTDSAPGKLNPHDTHIFFSSHRQFTAPVHVTDLATCRDSSSSPLSQPPPLWWGWRPPSATGHPPYPMDQNTAEQTTPTAPQQARHLILLHFSLHST